MEYKTWNTNSGRKVVEVDFDYDLHAYEVYNANDDPIGKIIPGDVEDCNNCRAELDNGADPVDDGWEDGLGNVLTNK